MWAESGKPWKQSASGPSPQQGSGTRRRWPALIVRRSRGPGGPRAHHTDAWNRREPGRENCVTSHRIVRPSRSSVTFNRGSAEWSTSGSMECAAPRPAQVNRRCGTAGTPRACPMHNGDEPPVVFDLGTGLRYFGASWPADRHVPGHSAAHPPPLGPRAGLALLRAAAAGRRRQPRRLRSRPGGRPLGPRRLRLLPPPALLPRDAAGPRRPVTFTRPGGGGAHDRDGAR